MNDKSLTPLHATKRESRVGPRDITYDLLDNLLGSGLEPPVRQISALVQRGMSGRLADGGAWFGCLKKRTYVGGLRE